MRLIDNKWLMAAAAALSGAALAGMVAYPHLDTTDSTGQFQTPETAPIAVSKMFPNATASWSGQGLYHVGTEAPVGEYFVTSDSGTFGCGWSRLSKNDGKPKSTIESGLLGRGQNISFRVYATDKYLKMEGACAWQLVNF